VRRDGVGDLGDEDGGGGEIGVGGTADSNIFVKHAPPVAEGATLMIGWVESG